MKKKLEVLITLIGTLFWLNTAGQETCKVLKTEIADKYTGECKNGLAHGKGVAEGKDKYTGNFKKGLPSGQGIYTWSTGEIYDGEWKEGKRNGEGKYTIKVLGRDSVSNGMWKDDIYIREIIPDPYTVYRNSSIIRYTVKKNGNLPERVLVEFKQAGGNNPNISGLFFFSSSGTNYSVGNKTGYENVEFPLTCKINYRTLNALNSASISCEFEIVIKQPGNWEITLYN
ncbi:MAG: hypothetical protein U0W24_11730 [Bacteroidales bacterium]